MARVTEKYMTEKINEILDRTESGLEVSQIYATRYTNDQYEGGAARQNILLKYKDETGMSGATVMLCFYSKKQLQQEINNGCELYIKFERNCFEWELSVRSSRLKNK